MYSKGGHFDEIEFCPEHIHLTLSNETEKILRDIVHLSATQQHKTSLKMHVARENGRIMKTTN